MSQQSSTAGNDGPQEQRRSSAQTRLGSRQEEKGWLLTTAAAAASLPAPTCCPGRSYSPTREAAARGLGRQAFLLAKLPTCPAPDALVALFAGDQAGEEASETEGGAWSPREGWLCRNVYRREGTDPNWRPKHGAGAEGHSRAQPVLLQSAGRSECRLRGPEVSTVTAHSAALAQRPATGDAGTNGPV